MSNLKEYYHFYHCIFEYHFFSKYFCPYYLTVYPALYLKLAIFQVAIFTARWDFKKIYVYLKLVKNNYNLRKTSYWLELEKEEGDFIILKTPGNLMLLILSLYHNAEI